MNTVRHAYGKTIYYSETLTITGKCSFKIDTKFHTVFLNVDEGELERILEFCPEVTHKKTKYGIGIYVKYSDAFFNKFSEDVQHAFEVGRKGFDMVVSMSEFINKQGQAKFSLQLQNARLNPLFDARDKSTELPCFDD